ncbi:translation initiation factor IF-1 [Pasteuria penetrans]|uniref:translation initiation factor IF-1 n=1 Tax=Pasteuria penetrans TaxID=86005 RepID=UPI000F902BC7|nr:translation initiation factor IF-1 [Pasteuria penetrans]
MSKKDVVEVEGVVKTFPRDAKCEVELRNGHIITVAISDKIRMNCIRVLPGDHVTVQLSPYDLKRWLDCGDGGRRMACPF